ncbi:MAG: nickel pincer cofactor biosynthesis protein LarC, partial [Bacteroidota bacterium]
MKVVYFDVFSGISGDMTLGAFVDAGLRIDHLAAELGKLNLRGLEVSARHLTRSGLTATKVDVTVSGEPTYHRHLHDIEELIDSSDLSQRVKEQSKKIFCVIGQAEAKIHNVPVEQLHFHEIGALDSIADIVGTAICLEHFGIEAVYSSAVRLGSGGYVRAAHGKLPLPSPATVEILTGYPVVLTEIPFELTTPTGAGIIKALSHGMLTLERLQIHRAGYGAGEREIEAVPNLLRVLIGESHHAYQEDEVVIVETNIDDMNPEFYPFVIEQLLNTGAHDAYLLPIVMKKGRPGILLSAMVSRKKLDDVLKVFFGQTTTLGVRIQQTERRTLPRVQKEVRTSLGVVKVKA